MGKRSTDGPVPCAGVSGWEDLRGIRHGFFGRRGGVSQGAFAALNLSESVGDDPLHVERNWHRLRAGLDGEVRWARMRQVHGAKVAVVEEESLQVGEADAMVTDRPGVALAVLTADCVPILFAAPGRGVIGVAHAGWRGTLAGVAGATVDTLRARFGVRADELRVGLGPSIGPCCFEVAPEVAEAFRAGGDVPVGALDLSRGERPRLDLRLLNEAQIARCGVPPDRIQSVGPCTTCSPIEYFSHRGQKGTTGRQASIIILAT